MSELADMKCIPCAGGVPPLTGQDLMLLLNRLGGGWSIVREHHLEKKYAFPDFRQALDFTNRVGELAEHEGHHPDIYLAWGKVILSIWTHKIDGLTESDFVFAAKADQRLHPNASLRQSRASRKSPREKDQMQRSEDIQRAVYDGMRDLRKLH